MVCTRAKRQIGSGCDLSWSRLQASLAAQTWLQQLKDIFPAGAYLTRKIPLFLSSESNQFVLALRLKEVLTPSFIEDPALGDMRSKWREPNDVENHQRFRSQNVLRSGPEQSAGEAPSSQLGKLYAQGVYSVWLARGKVV